MILRTFSPMVQRVIALGLLLLVLLAAVLFIIIPLITGTSDNLALLSRQRAEEEKARAILSGPPPEQGQLLDADSWIRARDGTSATAILTDILTGAGARRGVQVTVSVDGAPVARPPIMFSMNVTATGEQGAVLAFIGDIESGRPLLRFRRLALQRDTSAPPAPMGDTASIAPQSPNLTDMMIQETGPPPAVQDGNVAEPAAQVTMLRAQGVVLGLWGGR